MFLVYTVITISFTAGCLASANDFRKSSASGIEFGNYVLIEDEANTISAKSTNNKQQQNHKSKAPYVSKNSQVRHKYTKELGVVTGKLGVVLRQSKLLTEQQQQIESLNLVYLGKMKESKVAYFSADETRDLLKLKRLIAEHDFVKSVFVDVELSSNRVR